MMEDQDTPQIDDRELEIFPFSPVCSLCVHRKPGSAPRRCRAFPTGIPLDIWLGKDDHTKPREGDNGLRFERRQIAGKG
jgi:hypothetical protein